jgi:hypothetical protein
VELEQLAQRLLDPQVMLITHSTLAHLNRQLVIQDMDQVRMALQVQVSVDQQVIKAQVCTTPVQV